MREAQIYLKNIKKIRKEKTNGGGGVVPNGVGGRPQMELGVFTL